MKILATNGISKSGEIALQSAGFEVLTTKVAQEQLENYINDEQIDVIIVDNNIQIQQELIDMCPSLKLIGHNSTNMDNIDVQYAIDQGLHIVNTPLAAAESIAELVFAHLFGMVRFLHQSNREMPLEGDMNFNMLRKMYVGTELRNKTLGIIGMNDTGIATAKIALGIGMRVVFSHNEPKSIAIPVEFFDGQGVEFNFEAQPYEEVLKAADFVSLHVTDFDGYTIGEKELSQLKDGVGIINCTSAGSLDEVALIKAIESGKVRYAGLDTFENEPTPEIQLLMTPELSLSPKIAENTLEANERTGIELANKIITLLK